MEAQETEKQARGKTRGGVIKYKVLHMRSL